VAYETAANLDELEVGETLLVELSEPVCLVRLDEQDVRAIHNTCSHQHNPLDEGMVDDDNTLVCAAHAARFNLDTGESIGVPEVAAIPVYPCKIEDGTILVDVGQPLNQATPAGS
jgi:3-phenylpropionate/trans-cinnamate dioxygenase ferredoxin subunit